MEEKYSGLPGIDTYSPDVFETNDEGVAKTNDQISTQDEFESNDIEHVNVDKKEAFNKFKGKYLNSNSTDFSETIGKPMMRGYETYGEYEIIANRSITKETPEQKFKRLQLEMQELLEEVEKIKEEAKSSKQQKGSSSTTLAIETRRLQQQLQSWQADTLTGNELAAGGNFPQGTVQKKLQQELISYKEKAMSKPTKKEQIDEHCITYNLLYKPEHLKLTHLSKFSELEERLTKLEDLLGTDIPNLSTLFYPNFTKERSVMAALSNVQDKLAVLDTTDVEHIDARLQGLLYHLDELSSKKSDKENVEKQNKVSDLYAKVSKFDATADVVPELIYRLELLKSLHNQANLFSSSLTHLDSTQTAIAGQLQTQQKLLSQVASNFEKNVASIGDNCRKLDERISSLLKMYQKSGS
ncbi:dynactin subunit 2-like isoform X1 [Xenia sp. Carnegie-2017]|uniref:dynactin subunit 2-like isoform X1 n=1 Tax=Xenia sp. Carnegie-2017 TaxID=2897299 RepID=UPI001F03678D|nr:dynactin subunit 2-like isoform X1 [Xenia sp. Carnegie-2017]